ncbi:MAG: glycine--tRNA ligase [Candidatus Anstonellales archaeon]
MNNERRAERLIEIAKVRGLFFPSNEVYSGFAGFFDYGPAGFLIKDRIIAKWRELFIRAHSFHLVETSVLHPRDVVDASGHLSHFTDPIAACKKCGKKARADHLLQEQGITTSLAEGVKVARCPWCGSQGFELKEFNLMLTTGVGGDYDQGFMRPETAQGIFIDFITLFKMRRKLPLGIGQYGKVYRNEISPRNSLARIREFSQMELEYFFDPQNPIIEQCHDLSNVKMRFVFADGSAAEVTMADLEKKGYTEIMAYFLALQWLFYKEIGIDEKRMRLRELTADERAHYSSKSVDMEVETSFGVLETISNADRSDFDLSSHQKKSGKSFEVTDEKGRAFIPHVFEVSIGVDRTLLAVLDHSFVEKSEKKEWDWFNLPPAIAPYQCAVYPLMKKDGLAEKAKGIALGLSKTMDVVYDEAGSIGKRYARADEIGIPYALTIDYQTLEDDTITIRFRNDGTQIRIRASDAGAKIADLLKQGKVSA